MNRVMGFMGVLGIVVFAAQPSALEAASVYSVDLVAKAALASGPPIPPSGGGSGGGSVGGMTNQIVELAFTPEPGSGPFVEVFSRDNLIIGSWGVAANRLAVTGGVETIWADPASETAPTLFYIVNDTSKDSDGDGFTDLREILLKVGMGTNIFDRVDFDNDRMHDWYEIMLFGDLSQTGGQDFDGDGLDNEDEMMLLTSSVLWRSDPSLVDTDSDGTHDGIEAQFSFLDPLDRSDGDYDHDGLLNQKELELGTQIDGWDSDGDTLPDGIEEAWGTDPLVADDIQTDYDGDGLTLGEEYANGCDPYLSDTDSDGVGDGAEVAQGSYPASGSDGGNAPSTNDLATLVLTVGDWSGSRSEIYEMVVSGPSSTYRLRSGAPGVTTNATFRARKGESYSVVVHHVGSTQATPDYDYTAWVAVHSNTVAIIDDPGEMLGVYATSVTASDFNALNKTATVHVIKQEQVYTAFGDDTDSDLALLEGYLGELQASYDATEAVWCYTNLTRARVFDVHIVENQADFLAALETKEAYVSFDGHSNYGAGFAFNPYPTTLSGLVNVGETAAGVNWEGLASQLPYLYFSTNMISENPVNKVTDAGFWRYSNDAGVYQGINVPMVGPNPPNNVFTTVYGSGINSFHYLYQGEPYIILDVGANDMPSNLCYKWLLLSSCWSGTYYLDNFNQGTVFYSEAVCFGGRSYAKLFVQAVIEGKDKDWLKDSLTSVYVREEDADVSFNYQDNN